MYVIPQTFAYRSARLNSAELSRHLLDGQHIDGEQFACSGNPIQNQSSIEPHHLHERRRIKTCLEGNPGTPRQVYDFPSSGLFRLTRLVLEIWKPDVSFNRFMRIITCITARLFVGPTLCRNEEWLSTTTNFSENAWKLGVFLRLFPDAIKPLIGVLCPPAWQLSRYRKKASRIIVPIINERRQLEAEDDDGSYQKPDDFLQWMMDDANEFDGQPEKLVHRLLVMTLASSFTTTMAVTQAFFDICARPEYLEPLREEVVEATRGHIGLWNKAALTKMRKLDSFMRESQRLNPPSTREFGSHACLCFRISPLTCVSVVQWVSSERYASLSLFPTGSGCPRTPPSSWPLDPPPRTKLSIPTQPVLMGFDISTTA